MKEKFTKLFKNTGLLLVSNFSSKILVFLLVPLYTNVLTTEEYGIYDLMYSTIQLIYPIFTINIVESIFRFAIEKNTKKEEVFSIGIKYILISLILLVISSTIVKRIFYIEFLNNYLMFFLLLYFTYIFNDIVAQFVRGLDRVKDISVAGILGTIMMISSNIIALLILKTGLQGYFVSMILSFAIPSLYLTIKNRLWKYIKINKNVLKVQSFEKEMILYSLPLIFISIGWQINNVSDRYAVTAICGIEVNGIYSISYKIPAILNALQVVFMQAWQISAIKEFKSKDKEIFYTKIYSITNIVIVSLCSILIVSTKVLAKLLFAKEFYSAWIYVPFLLIYILFNTLSGTIGAIFSAAKDTKKLAISGIVGAITNIVLNIILIYSLGAIGAAIATLISSVVIWIIRSLYLKKYVSLKISYFSNIIQYALLIAQAACFIFIDNSVISYIIQGCIIIILIAININEMRKMKMSLYKIKMYIKRMPIIKGIIEKKNNRKMNSEEQRKIEALRKNGKELANMLFKIFEDNNLEMFLNFGSLLGIIRDGKFIEYDDDIDYGIIIKEDTDWNKIEEVLKKHSIYKIRQFKYNDKITEQAYQFKDLTFDVFGCFLDNEMMIEYAYCRKNDVIYNSKNEFSVSRYKVSPINKTRKIKINNIEYRVPEESEKYLESIYTKDWKTPNPNWKESDSPSIKALDSIGMVEYMNNSNK